MDAVLAHEPLVTIAVPGVHRVELEGRTIGYIIEAGTVYVSLEGEVYNTSCEVAQSLDLGTAVQRLLEA
jgi:hypothetical protein